MHSCGVVLFLSILLQLLKYLKLLKIYSFESYWLLSVNKPQKEVMVIFNVDIPPDLQMITNDLQ